MFLTQTNPTLPSRNLPFQLVQKRALRALRVLRLQPQIQAACWGRLGFLPNDVAGRRSRGCRAVERDFTLWGLHACTALGLLLAVNGREVRNVSIFFLNIANILKLSKIIKCTKKIKFRCMRLELLIPCCVSAWAWVATWLGPTSVLCSPGEVYSRQIARGFY